MIRFAREAGSLILGIVWANAVHADLYTVGAGGTHASIQEAVDAALVAPGSDEIHVAGGTFVEHLDFTPTGSGNMLHISGGWNESFSDAGDVPTVIDGDMSGRVFNINLDTGDGLTLENLTIRNGSANPAAGLLVTQYGDSVVQILNCEISNNVADSERSESGGLRVSVNETSQFSLLDSLVVDNQSNCSGTIDCREGGMGLQAAQSAQVTISRNEFRNNSVAIEEGSGFAAGAYLLIYDSASMLFEDNLFIGNTVTGTNVSGFGVALAISGDGVKTARRNRIEANNASVATPLNFEQMQFGQWGSNTSILSDSVIVKGNGRGLSTFATGDDVPVVNLVNLTVADNAGVGLRLTNTAAAGMTNLSNSIAVDNGEDASLGDGVTSAFNQIGGTGGFVDAAGGNYALDSGSSAVDAGTNSPSGGLGPTDIAGNDRVSGSAVDLGAYESMSDTSYADGFEAD